MWPILLALLPKLGGLLTGINLPAMGSTIFNVMGALFQNIRVYWKAWLIGLLISLQLLTAYEWDHTTKLLEKERTAHASDVQNFAKAQADADSKAKQAKEVIEAKDKANAQVADANYTSLLAKYRASVMRYQAHPSGGQGPYSVTLSGPQGPYGPSTSTNISITVDDAQICAENTARLQSAHDWAVQELHEKDDINHGP